MLYCVYSGSSTPQSAAVPSSLSPSLRQTTGIFAASYGSAYDTSSPSSPNSNTYSSSTSLVINRVPVNGTPLSHNLSVSTSTSGTELLKECIEWVENRRVCQRLNIKYMSASFLLDKPV